MRGERIVILAGGISSRMKRHCRDEAELDPVLLSDADNKSKSMIRLGCGRRPFLDYLLYNVINAGYKDIVIVIGEDDASIKDYYSNDGNGIFSGANISYAIQQIPEGRNKPAGTADALLSALKERSDWKGTKFTVCNSDNLYSVKALTNVLDPSFPNTLIDYDRQALKFPSNKIEAFAVTVKNSEGFLERIIEKPSAEVIDTVRSENGFVGVSMNLFRLDYNMIFPYLESCPFDIVRNEKELPAAIQMMVKDHWCSVFALRMNEHVPDLTDRHDIAAVGEYIKENFKNSEFAVAQN